MCIVGLSKGNVFMSHLSPLRRSGSGIRVLQLLCVVAGIGLSPVFADLPLESITNWLAKTGLTPETTLQETQRYCADRVPKLPAISTLAEWEVYARKLRADTLANTVYRGQAAGWRDAQLGVEYLDFIDGGPGYKIRKLRYEALPGLWIPALLYLPEKVSDSMPVAMNVNGHDRNGKAADYKQLRCINQAKRGIIALNPEWLYMGQFAQPDYAHYRLNQLDLCGTSGLAPFYLSMKRGLDVLLAQPHADPQRVAVSGLSGGGWQTIFISSLDTRVTLSNPVAGYSSLLTRIGVTADLGDSEQQPVDLGLTADYTHLTALLAPRATLLTFNAKDNCCFVAASALPPLMAAAEPIFKLYGRESNLRAHVNEIPGDHNFGQENREALYRLLGEHFFPGTTFDAHEIPSEKEVKSKGELNVELPEQNATLHSLAVAAMRDLPRDSVLPATRETISEWQATRRETLKSVLRYQPLQSISSTMVSQETKDDTTCVVWKVQLQQQWTLSPLEIAPAAPIGTTILVGDSGRQALSAEVQALLKAQQRVIAVDPFYLGDSALGKQDFLYALLLSTVGDRPLGVQAAQLAAIADWQSAAHDNQPVTIQAQGPRTSLMALCAAALQTKSIAEVRLQQSFGSLKQIIELNKMVNETPELFCFGLLEAFDIAQLVALTAPRKVTLPAPSERATKELAGLRAFYTLLGIDHAPVP